MGGRPSGGFPDGAIDASSCDRAGGGVAGAYSGLAFETELSAPPVAAGASGSFGSPCA